MAIQIRKASKKRAKLRLNIEGQPGGGKTFSSIKLGKLIIGESFKCDDSKVVVIDTERNSAELYADEFDFNVIELPAPNHGPKAYIEAIRAAEASGAEVIVIDSTTHEWRWCQAEADRIKPRFGNNKWSAWSEVKPPHDDFIDAMMGSKAHIIATTRAKPSTGEETDERGKKRIVKLGLESIQDDAIEYAYTIVMRVDADHNGIIHKTRCSAIAGRVFPLPGQELADILKTWLNSGEADKADDDARAAVETAKRKGAPVARKEAPMPVHREPAPQRETLAAAAREPSSEDTYAAIVDAAVAGIMEASTAESAAHQLGALEAVKGVPARMLEVARRSTIARMIEVATCKDEMMDAIAPLASQHFPKDPELRSAFSERLKRLPKSAPLADATADAAE